MSGFVATEEKVNECRRFLKDGGEHMAGVFYLEVSAHLVKDAEQASQEIAKCYGFYCQAEFENEHLVFEVDRAGYPVIETVADLVEVMQQIKTECSNILKVDPSEIKVIQHVYMLNE